MWMTGICGNEYLLCLQKTEVLELLHKGLNAEIVEMFHKNSSSKPKSLNIDNIRTLRVDW